MCQQCRDEERPEDTTLDKFVRWVKNHPGEAACVVAGGAGVGAVVAPVAFATPALAAAGLSSSGPVAGGLFATFQSAMGGVTAGSFMATAQSAAMGGYGVAVVSSAVQTAGGVVAGISGAILGSRRRPPGISSDKGSLDESMSDEDSSAKDSSDKSSSDEDSSRDGDLALAVEYRVA